MRPNNSVLSSIDEFRQSRLGFDILNGIDTAKLYPYTGSKKVSGRKEEGEQKENTGDEKEFSTFLWCAKHTIFLMPTQLLRPQLRLQFFGRAKIGRLG